MATCIRCGEAEAAEPLGFCPSCAPTARAELSAGFRKLREYLAGWARFDEWLRARGLA